MPKYVDPSRRCLPIVEWPQADQILWKDAVCGDGFENEAEHAAWRATTVQTNREGYGRWINFLMRSGADLALAPADRVIPEHVRAYLKELRDQGLRAQTRANRVSQLFSVLLVFSPGRDWDWLKQRFNRLAAIARAEREDQSLSIFTGDILDRSLKALNSVQRAGLGPEYKAAIEYRNWLMVSMLALMPLRRDNFS